MSRLPIKPEDALLHFHAERPLMGLDLGTKTIGIALSDSGWMIASPHNTLARKKFSHDAAGLLQLVRERNIGGIVLGLPMNMIGTDGARVQSTQDFARNLLRLPDFPADLNITLWDERLSTQAALRVLINEADLSRKRQDELVDKMAAGLILQSFLDYLRR